jgi:hypothetical protein
MTRLELANQLIEGQSAFHFAFIPKSLPIADCRLPIGLRTLILEGCGFWALDVGLWTLIGNRQLEIGNDPVCVERFELITKLILSQPPLPIGLHARILFFVLFVLFVDLGRWTLTLSAIEK